MFAANTILAALGVVFLTEVMVFHNESGSRHLDFNIHCGADTVGRDLITRILELPPALGVEK